MLATNKYALGKTEFVSFQCLLELLIRHAIESGSGGGFVGTKSLSHAPKLEDELVGLFGNHQDAIPITPCQAIPRSLEPQSEPIGERVAPRTRIDRGFDQVR